MASTTPPVLPWAAFQDLPQNAPKDILNGYKWELYDLANDPTQADDIAATSGLVPGGTSDTGGSTSSHEKKTTMRSEPMMNSGSETTARDPSEITWSRRRPTPVAAITPRSNESGIISATTIAAHTATAGSAMLN